ncbi:SHOCT domain-containing protein [Glycomyces tenuis]|uniref:SHOCT domain-containing protein n=1 Tax=Glycomyces tenuis TaxID=58116 RepID=UPI0003FA94F0|nr:SHOCT domain-containing protein [Glycomyces tenuis]
MMMWGWNGAGWGLVMMLFMFAVWGAVIWLIVTLARGGLRTWSQKGAREAEQVLASRYAAGEIDEDEYRQRLNVLRQADRDTG